MFTIIQLFELLLGLKINLSKSVIAGINMDPGIVNSYASLSGCTVLQWRISYLDVPLGGNPTSSFFWDPAVEKVSKFLDR